MSNKSRLQTNNTNLQALIDKANTLPDAGGSGGGGTMTVSVTVYNQSTREVHYWDGSQQNRTVAAGITETVNALNGVLTYQQEMGTTCSGSYLQQDALGGVGMSLFMFLSDGGTMTCARHSSGGGSE